MRSELGKLSLDETFLNRESLNARIVMGINEATTPWGMRCLRYEIRDIAPPASVRKAMELQAEAERRKRAQILDSGKVNAFFTKQRPPPPNREQTERQQGRNIPKIPHSTRIVDADKP